MIYFKGIVDVSYKLMVIDGKFHKTYETESLGQGVCDGARWNILKKRSPILLFNKFKEFFFLKETSY